MSALLSQNFIGTAISWVNISIEVVTQKRGNTSHEMLHSFCILLLFCVLNPFSVPFRKGLSNFSLSLVLINVIIGIN